MNSILRTERLVKSYRGKRVVNKLSLEVNQQEVVGLLGPNGAGKTTTFYMIVGVIQPEEGNIYFDDQKITFFPMFKRARLGISYLPQEASIFRKLTVEENILAILEMLPLTKKERREKVESLLCELKIEKLAKQRAYTLSGGERRRTEVARALVTDPAFILLDEPFTGIDPIVRQDIQNVIQQLRSRGIGVLITDHNVRETLEITDRAYIMYEGKILFQGTPEELTENKEARKVYLGEKFRL
ncbi:LPS export ABC transporter ATP-binding protein [candidate division WOR-3 bacterium]|nr:LPS export ABC transporter ATP-binding protein [candidate division WOR-3 bacterium]TET76050.1 MAG: LPS export ABC transporter ATP-binding protein [Candidatus Cloacimonadota bacterium]